MEFFNRIITHYGWEGTALAGVLLVMFGIQLYYYLFVYGRIPKYKDTPVSYTHLTLPTNSRV